MKSCLIWEKDCENTFDQNRIYLAVNYKLNTSFAFELGYMNWFQQQKSGVDFYNRDILRLSIIHSIDLKKKKMSNTLFPVFLKQKLPAF